MKRLILLMALVTAMTVLAPAAFADDTEIEADGSDAVETEISAAQMLKAEMIAINVAPDGTNAMDIIGLRMGSPSMGWGVIFKLQAYLGAGMKEEEFATEGGGYVLGQIRKAYLAGLKAGYEPLLFKNLGDLQKSHTTDKFHKAPPGLEKSHESNGKTQGRLIDRPSFPPADWKPPTRRRLPRVSAAG